MDQMFTRSLRKIRGRQRFYSSMSYVQYCDYFGPPPTPAFRPQTDPQDIPQLILDNLLPNETDNIQYKRLNLDQQLEVIPQIDGSENQTINQFLSPKKKNSDNKYNELQFPKRSYGRMRSQSQNSQYLIFNFLDRLTQKPNKKVKCK